MSYTLYNTIKNLDVSVNLCLLESLHKLRFWFTFNYTENELDVDFIP
jgi:hypothetical protein